MKKNIKFRFSGFALLFSFPLLSFSQEISKNKFGNGIINSVAADSSWSAKLGVRIQSLYAGEWTMNDTAGITTGNSEFSLRRARLKIEGFAYHPKFTYKFELGFSNREIAVQNTQNKTNQSHLLEAVVRWNFYKNLTLWVGQTKIPVNREQIISTADMSFTDNSLLRKEFSIDRDMGFQLRHHFKFFDKFNVREAFAVSQGEGRSAPADNLGGYQFTGRLELLPLGLFEKNGDYVGIDFVREQKPKISLAASFDANNRAVKQKSNIGKYLVTDKGFFETDIYTLTFDVFFKYKGFTCLTEYAAREAEQAISKNSDGSKTGINVNVGKAANTQLGYLFKNNWEIATRFTYLQLDKKITGQEINRQYTLGVSKYLVNTKLKIQSDISYLDVQNSKDNEIYWRFMLDIQF